jgi:hypothetical protein
VLGGHWRIPTDEQFSELNNFTDRLYIENYNNTGNSCIKFTSKKDPNKYIIIPHVDYEESPWVTTEGNCGGGYTSREQGWIWGFWYSNGDQSHSYIGSSGGPN